MKRILLGLGIGLFFAMAALPQSAQAAPIPGLFNTGLGGIGIADPNYSLDTGLAIGIVKHPAWVTAPGGSEWIGLTDGGITDPESVVNTYTTTFDLTGFDHTTASFSWDAASDNTSEVLLNGVTIFGPGALSFAALTHFDSAIGTGFLAGLNTIAIAVTNLAGSSGNPTGLLISGLTSNVSAVPIPAALPLFGTGLGILGFLGWRRRRKAQAV